MKLSNVAILLGLSLVTFSCVAPSGHGTEAPAEEKEMTVEQRRANTQKELLEEIKKRESVLMKASDKVLDAQAKQLVKYYEMYATGFASDSMAPEFLFRAADVSTGLGDYEKSIELYKTIESEYKSYIKRPEALYLIGFVYQDHLNKKGEAKGYYEKVIKEYPNHIFARDAKETIKRLHMTDEELVKMFQEQNKASK